MALTPEDVVNKRFNPTKFREGYDQDEVDDFLDEVVVELRRLGQENEELRQRLVAADSRISELQRSASQAPVAAAPPAPEAVQPSVAPVAAAVPAPVPTPAPAPDFGQQDQSSMDQSNTNNLLQLARRLHEEHVREGMEKRDQLVAEGHATAARIVSDAETQSRTAVEALEAERADLARKVEELSIFESSYREQLHSYIETQLRELENSTPIAGESDAPSSLDASTAAPVAGAFAAPSAFDAVDESAAPEAQEPAAPGYAAPSFDAPAYAAPVSAAPVYGAPVSSAPVYGDPVAPAPEAPASSSAPVYAPPFGDLSQAPAPQPGNASAPPAYAGFPAPQVTPEFPGAPQGDAESSQQPQYPGFPPRPTEYPGFGGN